MTSRLRFGRAVANLEARRAKIDLCLCVGYLRGSCDISQARRYKDIDTFYFRIAQGGFVV